MSRTPRRTRITHWIGGTLLVMAAVVLATSAGSPTAQESTLHPVALPPPDTEGRVPVERTIARRRSVCGWTERPFTLAEVGQLLWAAQGVTGPRGNRAAPSAGALYPLEVVLVTGRVEGLAAGVWHTRPAGHPLEPMAAGHQGWMGDAAAILALITMVEVTAGKYGPRARRYVPMEIGAAAENVYLQATALGLGTTLVGAFDDGVVGLAADEEPLALLPVGARR